MTIFVKEQLTRGFDKREPGLALGADPRHGGSVSELATARRARSVRAADFHFAMRQVEMECYS